MSRYGHSHDNDRSAIAKHSVNNAHRLIAPQLDPPPRLLLGPGPCNAHPRVLSALAVHQVGHLDPFFLHMMEEIKEMMKYVWQTANAFTLPVSGTGSAAMEAGLANLVEPGDVVLIGCNGYFGNRLCDMASRYGADVRRIERAWGTAFSLEEIEEGLRKHRPMLTCIVHAETSTGVCQPMEGVGALCHKYGSMLMLDCVTSISGVPLFIDKWEVDVAYAGTQKCLSCPPGVSPFTMNQRALDKLMKRKTKVPNWYLDMSMIAQYLVSASPTRTYHHTAPINMNYGLREALRIVTEEGLEARWKRHLDNAELLWAGLEKLGIQLLVKKEHRLPSLTTAIIPPGVDGKAVTTYILKKYNIEIGNGLGDLAGKGWRFGLMGYNSRPDNVMAILGAMEDALKHFKSRM
eukprot:tig00000178_g12738.t1